MQGGLRESLPCVRALGHIPFLSEHVDYAVRPVAACDGARDRGQTAFDPHIVNHTRSTVRGT